MNNSSTERFAVTTNAQNILQHFQRGEGGKCPPVDHGCGRPCQWLQWVETRRR